MVRPMKKRPPPVRRPTAPVRPTGWNTTDGDELHSRRLRAVEQQLRVQPRLPGQHPFYADYLVTSASVAGHVYTVQLRTLDRNGNLCTCPDFAKNGLGHCKHIESALSWLRKRGRRVFESAARLGSPLVEVGGAVKPSSGERVILIRWPDTVPTAVRTKLSPFFSASGELLGAPSEGLPALQRELDRWPANLRACVRIGLDALALAHRDRDRRDRAADRAAWLADVAAGKRSGNLVRNATLLDYQRAGALHLAFGGRALLADEMGLGKTIQAIAACELLRQLRRINRVLVIAPASLKTEWQEQIARFTETPASILLGGRPARLRAYREPVFYTLANYEQIVTDWREINEVLRPDVVILDEAQRIKNWKTRTAAHLKRLHAPRAFVLTGTPVENRIDEVYSIAEFLDPGLFGSLFRFNRDFYELDDRGKPVAVRNLDELQRRLSTIMLRRRKAEVETELPERTAKNYFVPMHPEQKLRYGEYEDQAAMLAATAARRPLLPKELEKLQLLLSCMRMLCDTPYILDEKCRVCPKLGELEAVLDELLSEPDHKAIIFSEWVRMLDLVAGRLDKLGLGYALHTGSVPQARRREEINRFKADPSCRVFLSSDAGATGLNLQCANVVINLDLPWNPAKLEQRIARAWRKNQTRTVRVVNLVTENSIESRMLATLELKRGIARGALDDPSVTRIDLNRNREAKLRELQNLLGRQPETPSAAPARAAKPDPLRDLSEDLAARLGTRLTRLERIVSPQVGKLPVLLLHVADDAPGTRQLAEDLVRQNYAHCTETPPALELLDPAAVALLRRLTEAGLIQPGPSLREVLAGAADASPAREAWLRQRREAIRQLRDQAKRSLDVARLLSANGFAAESSTPWRETLQMLVRALRLTAQPLEETVERAEPPAGEEARLLLEHRAGATPEEQRIALTLGGPGSTVPGELLDSVLGKIFKALDQGMAGHP